MERQADDGAADVVVRAEREKAQAFVAEARLQALQSALREEVERLYEGDGSTPQTKFEREEGDRLENLLSESEETK